ncbi:mitogen-activated protein kinase binding protein 1 [Mortierella antarctica]|nr:mitogen-activated protein kinase binding protein 1 [Mortierella antarctica]
MFPALEDDQASQIPRDTFVTYSADGSIKFWNLDENVSLLSPSPDPESMPREYGPVLPSKEISRVLYVDETSKTWIQKPDIQEPGFNVVPTECGIRTIKISSDGLFIASGDKGGNLRVHDLRLFAQVTYQEAHDTEIMAIDFTDPQDKDSPLLVATAGRDRLLHVFDVHNNYALLQTLDDHSSSITTIKFTPDGSRMMSCGADKSIIFRNRHKSSDGITYQPYHQAPGRATFYDMDLHGQSQTMSAVSGDRRFTVFTLETGKPIKTFKAETKGDDLAAGMAEICSMTHISLDPTGTIAAASGSDKSVRLYDLIQGTCLAHMICHSELVTGIKFTNSYDRIISTSADGCILVWKLLPEVVRKIQIRIQENVTLPSRLQAKTVESAPPSAPGSTLVSPMVKPVKLKRSTDRLGAYSSEYSGTSRRNSTTSIVSEDLDPRSEDNSDDWSDRTTSRVDARIEDLSKLSFTPVSTAKSPIHLPASVTSASRPRAHSSYAKTPINRSRQNSFTQPTTTTPKHPGSSKLGSQPDLPPWNRNIIKEKLTPSSRSNRPPSPRQAVTKTLVKEPPARPRARSMSVANESPLSRSNGAKVEVPSTKPPPLPRSLPKKPAGQSRHGHDDDDEDDELSDDTESGFDDGLGVPPPATALQNRMSNKTKASKGLSSQVLSSPSSKLAEGDGNAMMSRSMSVDNLASARLASRQAPPSSSSTAAFQMDSSRARSETDDDDDDETVAEDASDERDGDDEINMEVDESMSDTGSDVERPSPLHIPGPGSQQPSAAGDGKFDEGEFMLRSPKSSTITSPGKVSSGPSRVTSIRDVAGMEGSIGRRSLSAKFLTAHAATIMQSLISKEGQDAQEGEMEKSEPAPVDEPEKEKENEDEPVLESRRDAIETGDKPTQQIVEGSSGLDHDERPTSVDSKLSSRDSGSGLSLEEQLNPMSLNKAAMRRKQMSLSSGSKVLIQLGRGTDVESTVMDRTRISCNSNDLVSPISPTSDLSHRTFTGLTSAAQIVQETLNELPTTVSMAQETTEVPERAIKGILASPVAVKSSVNSPQYRRSVNLSSVSDGFAPPSTHAWEGTSGSGSGPGASRPPSGVYTRKVAKRLSVASSMNGDGAERDRGSIAGITRSHESLQEAFDRISFLIAHKSNTAQMEGKSVEDMKRAQQWMKETREGLLNLVGEAQGRLWALDKVVQEKEKEKHM